MRESATRSTRYRNDEVGRSDWLTKETSIPTRRLMEESELSKSFLHLQVSLEQDQLRNTSKSAFSRN